MDVADEQTPRLLNARDSCQYIRLIVQMFREAFVCSHKVLKISGILFIYIGSPTIASVCAKVIKIQTLRL
jgi:hypothetical protein